MKNYEGYKKRYTTKYTAHFADGTEISALEGDILDGREIRNRLDLYNHICSHALGRGHGGLKEITCEPFPA